MNHTFDKRLPVLDPLVAFEYLEDGGLMACHLNDGEVWQLGPPAGVLFSVILHAHDYAGAVEALSVAMPLAEHDVTLSIDAFCAALIDLGLLHWSS